MAKTVEFTIRQIEALAAPAEGRVEYRDARTQGLYLRVTATGVKTFSFVGRAKGSSRVERLTLGKYPQVKPEEARTRAKEIAGRLASGTSVASIARDQRGEMTVGELWDLYFKYIRKTTKAPDNTKVVWATYVESFWATRRLSDVTAVEVERWHLALPELIVKQREERAAAIQTRKDVRRREIAARRALRRHGPDPRPKSAVPKDTSWKVTGRVVANRALDLLRAMYNFGLSPTRRYFTGVNPASNHKHYAAQERERFLQPDELRPFFQSLADEPNETMRDFFLIALLTGARRANVLAMKWENVQLTRGEWRIAGEFTKNGQPQTVTLSPEAVQILEQRKKASNSKFVFSSDRSDEDDHIREPKSAWRRVKLRAGLTDLRIHDLRRTLGSWQARTGASLVLIGKSLNHRDQQSTSIYARLDLDPVRQSVDRATSAMFEAAGVKQKAKVVNLPDARSSTQRRSGKTVITKAGR